MSTDFNNLPSWSAQSLPSQDSQVRSGRHRSHASVADILVDKLLQFSPTLMITSASLTVLMLITLEIILPIGPGWFLLRVLLALSGATAGTFLIRVWMAHRAS